MSVHVTKPTLEGERDTKAWRIDVASLPDKLACVGYWIVQAPWAHPCWNSYLVMMAHLREQAGVPTAYKINEQMTHECLVYALHPDEVCDPLTRRVSILEPVNIALQMMRQSDEDAAQWLADRVADIVRGTLSPDSDFRKAWLIKAERPDAALTFAPTVTTLHLPHENPPVRH